MCSEKIEKNRLRRATFLPVDSQNCGSSGRQSSIHRPRPAGGLGGGAATVFWSSCGRCVGAAMRGRSQGAVSPASPCGWIRVPFPSPRLTRCGEVPADRVRRPAGTGEDRPGDRHPSTRARPRPDRGRRPGGGFDVLGRGGRRLRVRRPPPCRWTRGWRRACARPPRRRPDLRPPRAGARRRGPRLRRRAQRHAGPLGPRGSGPTRSSPAGRARGPRPARSLEAIVTAARLSADERRVRHLGYLLAEVAYSTDVDAELVGRALRLAEQLNWRQLAILAGVGRRDRVPHAHGRRCRTSRPAGTPGRPARTSPTCSAAACSTRRSPLPAPAAPPSPGCARPTCG